VTDFIKQKRGVRQGCCLSMYLCNIIIDDGKKLTKFIADFVKKEKQYRC
jgi:hypothetical protein